LETALNTPDLWSTVGFLRDEFLSNAKTTLLAPPLRAARTFRHVLDHLPIGLCPSETLAGDIGWEWESAEDFSDLKKRITQRNNSPKPPPAPAEKTPADLLAENFHCFGGYTLAHTCVDYERIVSEGVTGLIAQIQKERSGADPEKAIYLEAMEIALLAVVAWAERYAVVAETLTAAETKPEARERLTAIAAACRQVPLRPARNFHEALQAVWFIHVAVGIAEGSDASLSLGRIDQFLYPLFKNDIDHGTPLSELEKNLTDLHRKLNRFGDPACTVNLGGVDQNGNDLFNPLSKLIVKVARNLQLPSPILAARIHKDIPAEVFDLLTDPKLFGMGQPTFYGEFSCRNALLRRGVPKNEIHKWAANSCMGLVIPGEEISDMWGSVVSLLLPLELALNAGRPFHHELPLPLKTPPKSTYTDFDELFETVLAYTNEILDFCIRQNQQATLRVGRNEPNPFLSALIREGISRGLDRCLGGARYHTVIVEAFGLVNAADALLAVKQLVFDQKKYTLTDLTGSAKDNFQNTPAIRKAILDLPKYGDNEPDADEMAQKLARRFAQSVTPYSTNAVCYAPSFHTLNAHIGAGMKFGAGLDGRLAGEPIAKNIGPIPGKNRQGHTALLLSAAAIDQAAFFGGQALDISLTPNSLRTRTDVEVKAFQALLQTYFDLGGLQVQVNSVNPDTLRRAMTEPENHQNIIVRIAGYSAKFVTLDRPVQEEMIHRFSHGL
jgi:pyruvate-formate lyase